MPRFSGKKTDVGVPVTIDKDRYVEGDSSAALEGSVALGEKPGNTVFPIQIDAAGYLKVALAGGGAVAGTEYLDGALNVGSKGTLVMGDDGANLQNVSVDNLGRLQVEVVSGEYDGVQYQDGAAIGSPIGTVALGHDGSNVYPIMVDSNGRVQVDVLAMPGGTFEVEGNALNKGVLIQGDDGTDRHNVAVDNSGNVQIDIVEGSVDVGTCGITRSQIVVDISTAGTTTLKVAQAGHQFTVMSISLTIAAENNLTLKNGASALSGPMDFGGSGEPHGWQANLWPCGLVCSVGQALNLTTSTTGQVSGFIVVLDES